MFIKVLKERKLKAEKFDELKRIIEERYKDADSTLNHYESLPVDSVEKCAMSGWIINVGEEWRVLKSLLKVIERV